MGVGLHNLHVHVDRDGEHVIELDLEISGDINLEDAHRIADKFEARAFGYWPKAKQVITHLEPMVDMMQYPIENANGGFQDQVRDYLQEHLDSDSKLDVQALEINGQKRLVIVLTMPPKIQLSRATVPT